MTNHNNAAQAANENPLGDEYVNEIIQRHGYDSPESVIARLHQWIGLHSDEDTVTLLMYEAHKALSKLRAPVADGPVAFSRAEISFPLTIPETRVYLAGPMTGHENHNFPDFHAAAERLRGLGLEVVNPADHELVSGLGWSDYMRWDLVKLAGCHSVYVLPGWEKSKGASLEVSIAHALGMPVFTMEGAQIMASAPVDDERTAFEAEYVDHYGMRLEDYDFDYDPATNRYRDDCEQSAWWGWHTGRAALASAPVAGEAVYTLRVRGAIQAWTPTAAAFSIPDGEHQLFLCPAAPQPSAEPARILFPSHLRKMWSGGEVQAWLDQHQGVTPPPATAKGSLARYRQWKAEQDQAAAPCTCPSGDGSLHHPCPAHPRTNEGRA